MDERTDDLGRRLRAAEATIETMRTEVADARTAGIAVGVLLARSPGWTEQEALAAWERACAEFTRGGNTRALASYVVQTGALPGDDTQLTGPAEPSPAGVPAADR